MTTPLFNQLLEAEVRDIAQFYLDNTHYEPTEYVRIVADGPDHTAICHTEAIGPGDRDLVKLMRRLGAKYALGDFWKDPLTIFVVQSAYAINLEKPAEGPQPTMTVYGVTNDGRYNLGMLAAQWDEDGRLYVVPQHVYHWGGEGSFAIDPLPYLEFFRTNDDVREKVPA